MWTHTYQSLKSLLSLVGAPHLLKLCTPVACKVSGLCGDQKNVRWYWLTSNMKAVPAFVRNPKQILLLKNTRFLLLLKHYVEELIASARCNLIVVITGRLAVGIYINKSSLDIHTYIHTFILRLQGAFHVLSCSIISTGSRPWDKGGSGLQNFFWPFGTQYGLKIRGSRAPQAPPLDLPLSCYPFQNVLGPL